MTVAVAVTVAAGSALAVVSRGSTARGGRIVYTAGSEGTAGYVADEARRRNVLESAGDPITLRFVSAVGALN